LNHNKARHASFTKIFLAAVFITLLSIPFGGARVAHATAIALNAPSTSWYRTVWGANFDVRADQQATSSIDVLGDATHPLLYMYYDSTASELYFASGGRTIGITRELNSPDTFGWEWTPTRTATWMHS
jgi:hypothetical protein